MLKSNAIEESGTVLSETLVTLRLMIVVFSLPSFGWLIVLTTKMSCPLVVIE